MKKVSSFSLVAAVIFFILAVGSFLIPRESIYDIVSYLNFGFRLVAHVLVLAFFASMFFSNFHRKTAVIGGVGAIAGCIGVLLLMRYRTLIGSGDYTAYCAQFQSDLFNQLNIALLLISGSLLFAEFRHYKTFRTLALFAVIFYSLITAVPYLIAAVAFDSSRIQDLFNDWQWLVDLMTWTPDLSFYGAMSLYMLALSFGLKQKNCVVQSEAEV